jgi:creatinine amidohydrolase
VLPTIPFGCSPDVMAFPYTLSVRPTTLFRLFEDVVASISAHGIRKLMILNGHGGNTGTIEAFTREFYGKYGAFLVGLDWCATVADVIKQVQEVDDLEHADEIETSQSLELCPDLVRMDAAERTSTNRSRLPTLERHGARFMRPWHLYTRNGGVGDPTKATREKGATIVAAAVARIADMLVELARAEHDERFPY